MADDYADAIMAFDDAVAAAMNRAVNHGLSEEEVIRELRRIADEGF